MIFIFYFSLRSAADSSTTEDADNVSKAAVKALTESLAHSLIPTSVTAHLLIPGYTYTKLTSNGASAIDGVKPDAAWTSEQVAQELVNRMEKEFYILCPDSAFTLPPLGIQVY